MRVSSALIGVIVFVVNVSAIRGPTHLSSFPANSVNAIRFHAIETLEARRVEDTNGGTVAMVFVIVW